MNAHKASTSHLLVWEQRLSRAFFILLSVLGTTGFTTYLAPTDETFLQWFYLLHSLAGLILVPWLLLYTLIHVNRTLGHRRGGMMLLGLAAVGVLFASGYSGLELAFRGQTEVTHWRYSLHVVSGMIASL